MSDKDTRTCKKCGWVYPATQRGVKCKICGEPFEEAVCRVCGNLIPRQELVCGRALCRECHNREERASMLRYIKRRDSKLEATFNEWLDRIKKVPKAYPTLTEAQWMEACQYFNGCALCGNESIEARGFFIHFKDGGRYCNWNIIPMCERCAQSFITARNPFSRARRVDNTARKFNMRNQLPKITEYLGGKLDDATGTNNSSGGHAD